MKVKCPHCKTIKTINKTDKNKQVRCSKREGGCGERFYVKENIVLEKKTIEKKDETNKTIKNPTINHKGSSPVRFESIDTLETILECMDRGISTIRNKPEVKAKKGAYYWNFVKWTRVWNALKLSFDVREEEKR